MKDLFGKAILDYQTNNAPEAIITETNISEPDEMSVAYLFRNYSEMPKLEQKALQLCKGKILDIGCGAGSHSLYLQEKGFEVTSIDISTNAIKACELRGLTNAKNIDLLVLDSDSHQNKFDTILLLMNGTGIFKTIVETPKYLQKLKSLLNPNGQVLIDSSDIIYMYDEDDVPTKKYYGELEFIISYKNELEIPFPWLYLDYNLLDKLADENGLKCQMIQSGKHFDTWQNCFD
jgi:cyclopropane fatty-acyl-phospholipid synthase-like methyltransferase